MNIWKRTASILVVSILALSGCTSPQKVADDPALAPYRAIASTSETVMEDHFQAIIQNPQAQQMMISYIDRLYDLLIEINRGIVTFDKELDAKLAMRKASPSMEIEEPLQSKTYSRIWKMWQLRDKYIAEISWFYLRMLQIRTDKNLAPAERARVRVIQRAVGAYLKNTKDIQRVELQPLMAEISEIFKIFSAHIQAVNNGKVQPGEESDSLQSGFSDALFGTHEDLKRYITARRIPSLPTSISAQSQKRRTQFIQNLEVTLANMPDLVIPDRDPQAVQNLTCDNGKKLCASSNDNTGNIVGKVFPPGVWTLTYDDGPGPKSTGDLLDVLKSHRDPVNPTAKATFFWLAQQVQKYPNWVERAVKEGHSVANHSFSHANLATLNTAGRTHEIVESNQVITSVVQKYSPGYKIQYFRCPYGSCYAPKVPEAREMIAKQGQIHAYWRVDSLDWKLLNGPKVADLIIKQIQLMDHGVVLMHDIHPTTIEATKLVLAWLKKQNSGNGTKYKLVTIPEAVDLVNGVQ